MDNNGYSGSTDKAVELEPLRPPTRPPTVGSGSGTATGEFENAAAVAATVVGLPPHHQQQQQPSGQDPYAGRSSKERARDEARKILQSHPIMTNFRNISKPTVGSAVTLADSEPGWAVIDGDIGGHGYNETKVDLIAVPCPGADPLHPWTCDPVTDSDFGSLEKPGSPKSTRPPYVWIQQGIRNKEPMIRVLVYKHRGLREGINIDMLAVDLLDQVLQIRQGVRPSRPLFFIAHSIGGLVVKRALLKAHEDSRYKDIRNNCHGVGFFATPHRGSSYMSMRNLRESVRELLHLQRPLPNSLINQLKVNSNNPWLDKVHEQFVDIASELRIWSFYETIDSELSNTGADFASEVKFTAPLVSVKSALLELAREDVFAIDNSHANIASFGPNNISTMHDFLEDLHTAVLKAKSLSKHVHHPLRLKDHVKVEIVGFYEDSDPESDSTTRLYATKTQLGQYLQKGAEPFLQDRLSKVQHKRHLLTRAFTLKSSTVITETDDDDGTGPSSGVDSDASSMGSFSAPSLIVDHVSSTGPDLIHPELFGQFGAAHHAKKKITWIHVPFNNPIWAKEVIKRIEETRGQNLQKLLSREHWQSKQVQGLQAQSQPSFFKPCACLVPADAGLPVSPFSTPSVDRRISLLPSPRCIYIYLPYLHFDTYCNIIRRRKLIEKRLDHGRAKPVPEYVEQLESLELKVIWEYIGFDPPLNCRRTLDQFAYPSLKDTHARDDDQMLYKLTKHDQSAHNEKAHSKFSVDPPSRKSAVTSVCTAKGSDHDKEEYDDTCSEDESEFDFECDVKDGKLLMVDQLWLWAIDNDTLATFFPKRESSPKEGTLFQQADLRNIVYNELNGDLTGRTDNALDLAAFTVLHAVMAFVELSTHKDLDIFRIFEEAIGLLAERMTQNMRRFRTQNFISTSIDDLDDDDSGRTLSIKERHKRELEKAEKENRENTSALLELRDMEDELSTLLRLFETQEGVVNQLKEIYNNPSLKEITKNGQGYLDKAMDYLTEYKQLTSEMVKRVETTKKDYEKMLEMAQRQAQVDEVRWSRLQTELAASQNLSVMIFTTFTVIFLPLSFFTGIFGMNTREWHEAGADPDNPDGSSTIPTLGYIGAIALPVSFFLIFTSLVAAFSSRVQGVCKKLFKATTGKIKHGYRAIKVEARKIEPERNKMRKQRKEAMRKRAREEEKARRQKELSYDFWADVMNARHERHQIPDVNKHDF